ncbi:MAG: hypothetical protein Q9180_004456 [Flavoplaca navasiana]
MKIERLLSLLRATNSELPSLKRVIWWDQQPQDEHSTTYGPFLDVFELGISFWCKEVRFQYINASFYEDTILAGNEYPPGVKTADFKGWLSPEDLCVMEEEFDDGKWLDQHLGMCYEDTIFAGKDYPLGVNTADFEGWLSPEDLCVMKEEFDDGEWLDEHL